MPVFIKCRSSRKCFSRLVSNSSKGSDQESCCSRPSDPGVPFVIGIIFPIAALAAINAAQAVDCLDPLDVLGLFVAELALDPQPQGGAVGDGQQVPVHSPGEDRLGVESINEIDALV